MRAAFCQQRGLAVGTLDKFRQRVHDGRPSGGRLFVPVEVVPSTAQDVRVRCSDGYGSSIRSPAKRNRYHQNFPLE